jgi:hypothetical protein
LKDEKLPRIDYTKPETRFAYVYAYVTAHASFVYKIIQMNRELQEVFDKQDIEIACIGGGPGSDLVGILKYLVENNKRPDRVWCDILDAELAWNETWRYVNKQLDVYNINTNSVPFDVTERVSWERHSDYLNSDLFTFIYFMSEVFRFKEESTRYFDHFFANVKPGAMIIYLDNRDDTMSDWFDSFINKYDYEVIVSSNRYRMSMNSLREEKKSDLGQYFDKFGDKKEPKLTGRVAYRICRKL